MKTPRRTVRTFYTLSPMAARQLRWLERTIGAPPETIIETGIRLLFATWRLPPCHQKPNPPTAQPTSPTSRSESPQHISASTRKLLNKLTSPSPSGAAERLQPRSRRAPRKP